MASDCRGGGVFEARAILHADLDAFFASVEQRDNPALRGRPVLVGGSGRRGVVAAASYEARAFGCRSAMPMSVARRLCPHAEVVRGDHARYRAVSERVFGMYHDVTPAVEPVSIDEAFLDVTGSLRLLGEPERIARGLKERVRAETGLTLSVGLAENKFLAKLASDLEKPDGLVVIEPGRAVEVLDPLPVTRLWGVGPAAERRLHGLGLRTVGDVRRTPETVLVERFGEDQGRHLARLSRGEDDRPVVSDREAKSISHEQTFGEDLELAEAVRGVLSAQCEAVGRRLRRHGRTARTVTVKIRFGDFETVTRSRTLEAGTDLNDEIRRAALSLFDGWASAGFRPVRLIGVGVSQLGEPGAATQAGLFDAAEVQRRRRLDAATDAIAAKHGDGSIGRGSGRAEGRGRSRARDGTGRPERTG